MNISTKQQFRSIAPSPINANGHDNVVEKEIAEIWSRDTINSLHDTA